MTNKPGLAIVTGAAGGIGGATAEIFVKEGRDLILCDLKAERLDEFAFSLRSTASRDGRTISVETVAGDVCAASFPSEVETKLSGREIAVLVDAAGISPGMSTDGYRIYDINFTATKALIDTLLPHMAPDGVVIPIASIAGQMTANALFDWSLRRYMAGSWFAFPVNYLVRYPGVAYGLSKRAVQLYVASMATEIGKRRIVSVSPGTIDTEMVRGETDTQAMMSKMLRVTPAERIGKAEEVAVVIAFLASKDARYITGADILVDGGCWSGIAKAGGPMKLQ